MSTIETPDTPQDRCDSFLLDQLHSLTVEEQNAFHRALLECSNEIKKDALALVAIINDPNSNPGDRGRSMHTLLDQLRILRDDEGRYGMDLVSSESGAAERYPALQREVDKMDSQESEFAERLRALMNDRHISQRQLADQLGCSQPAISQMLNRKCRPQRRTLEKLAGVFEVDMRELWPDIEVMDALDSVAAFQQDDQIMSEAMAKALREPSSLPDPKPIRSLPSWKDETDRE